MVKRESWVGELAELKSVGLFDKGSSLSAPNNKTKSSLLAMASLQYVVERNSSPQGPLEGYTTKTREYRASGSPGRLCLAQNQPFIVSTQLSHLWMWIVEGVREEREAKRERGKDCATLVESGAEAQGWGVPQDWVPVSYPPTPTLHDNRHGTARGRRKLYC